MHGVGIHAVVGDLPNLGLAVLQDFGGGFGVAQGDGGLVVEVRERQLDGEGAVHAAVVQLEELVDGLGLQGRRGDLAVLGLGVGQAVVLNGDVGIGRHGGVHGRVVEGLGNDGRVLGSREGTPGRRRGLEGRLESRHIEGRRRSALDLHLHEGAGVGAVARESARRAAGGGLVRSTREVIEADIKGRDGRQHVVVEDQGGPAGDGREVDDDVGPLGGHQEEAMVGDVQHDDVAPVHVVGRGLGRNDDGFRQEAALIADLDDVRSLGTEVHDAAIAAIGGPEGEAILIHGPQGRFGRGGGDHLDFGGSRRIGIVEAHAEGAVVGRVQDAETVGLGLEGHGRIGRAVDDGRIEEGLDHKGGIGRSGVVRIARIDTGLGAVGEGDAVDGIGHRHRGPEPRTVVPPSHGVGARGIAGVLVGHVDVGIPEIAVATPVVDVPGGIGVGQVAGPGDEGLVLDDEGDAIGVDAPAVVGQDAVGDELLLDVIDQQVAGRFTHVDVQAGEAEGVVVVEHQPAALLVAVEVGADAVPSRGVGEQLPGAHHVGHIGEGRALLVGRGVASGGDPLVRRAVTDVGIQATMEVELAAVLGVGGAPGGFAGTHEGGVHGQRQVAGGAEGQLVAEGDAHGTIPLGEDEGPEVVGGAISVRVQILVATQAGGRQVGVHLLGVIHQADVVVVGTREGGGVGHGHGDVVPQVVFIGRGESGEGVHELADDGRVRPVGDDATHVVGSAQGVHDPRRGNHAKLLLDASGLRNLPGSLGGLVGFPLGLGALGGSLTGLGQRAPTNGALDDGILVATHSRRGHRAAGFLSNGRFGGGAGSHEQGCG